MKLSYIAFPLVFAGTCLLAGCLPTVEPAKHPASDGAVSTVLPPPSTAVPTSPQDVAKSPARLPAPQISTVPSENGGAPSTQLKMAVQDKVESAAGNATIRVAKEADGNYSVNGGEGLSGTIKQDSSGSWAFTGTIKFPLKGYSVGEPFATSLDNLVHAPGGAALQKQGAQTIITIPFKYPVSGTAAERVEEEFPLHFKFDAPASTEFAVFLMPGT